MGPEGGLAVADVLADLEALSDADFRDKAAVLARSPHSDKVESGAPLKLDMLHVICTRLFCNLEDCSSTRNTHTRTLRSAVSLGP